MIGFAQPAHLEQLSRSGLDSLGASITMTAESTPQRAVGILAEVLVAWVSRRLKVQPRF